MRIIILFVLDILNCKNNMKLSSMDHIPESHECPQFDEVRQLDLRVLKIINRIEALEIENAQLKKELEQYQTKFGKL